jgi:hypothetical protein
LKPKAADTAAARLPAVAEKYTKPSFINESQWGKLVDVTTIPAFTNLLTEITQNEFQWKVSRANDNRVSISLLSLL